MKYLVLVLTILLSLYSLGYKAQCVLTEDECRKIIILKNERDSYLESWEISDNLLSNVKQQIVLKDSVTDSYVIIADKQFETIQTLNDINKVQEKDIVKLKKAVRFRNIALRVGIPVGFGLGFFAGSYLFSVGLK